MTVRCLAIPASFSGTGLTSSGIVYGNYIGSGTWLVTGVTGTCNGNAITAIVPVGVDPNFVYTTYLTIPRIPPMSITMASYWMLRESIT